MFPAMLYCSQQLLFQQNVSIVLSIDVSPGFTEMRLARPSFDTATKTIPGLLKVECVHACIGNGQR